MFIPLTYEVKLWQRLNLTDQNQVDVPYKPLVKIKVDHQKLHKVKVANIPIALEAKDNKYYLYISTFYTFIKCAFLFYYVLFKLCAIFCL